MGTPKTPEANTPSQSRSQRDIAAHRTTQEVIPSTLQAAWQTQFVQEDASLDTSQELAGRSAMTKLKRQTTSSHSAEWQVKVENRWQDLGADACRTLNEAEKMGLGTVQLTCGAVKYAVDLR